MFKPTFIVIHHSASPAERTTFKDIEDWHKAGGKKMIGYHGMVDITGKPFIGRPLNKQGAHCRFGGFNSKSLGYCIFGNFEKEEPSNAAWFTAHSTVANWCRTEGIPVKNVIGHKETGAATLCPGKNFNIELFRKAVEIELKRLEKYKIN